MTNYLSRYLHRSLYETIDARVRLALVRFFKVYRENTVCNRISSTGLNPIKMSVSTKETALGGKRSERCQ